MISVQNVHHRFGHQEILSDVSVTIPEGGITALIGPNGAGKSTLLALMARLHRLQSGRIQIDDLTIGECANDVLARKLAILCQSAAITPRLTVRQLVTFGRYPHHKGRPTARDAEIVDEAIEDFELRDLADRMIDSLSGGQQQRALVAMVFAQDTPYMLLDEPLNNLDIAASRHLMQKLRKLAASKNRTVIIVLHDINYAAAYADHVVAMKQGRICAEGPVLDVVTTAEIRRIFETETRVEAIDGRPVILV